MIKMRSRFWDLRQARLGLSLRCSGARVKKNGMPYRLHIHRSSRYGFILAYYGKTSKLSIFCIFVFDVMISHFSMNTYKIIEFTYRTAVSYQIAVTCQIECLFWNIDIVVIYFRKWLWSFTGINTHPWIMMRVFLNLNASGQYYPYDEVNVSIDFFSPAITYNLHIIESKYIDTPTCGMARKPGATFGFCAKMSSPLTWCLLFTLPYV